MQVELAFTSGDDAEFKILKKDVEVAAELWYNTRRFNPLVARVAQLVEHQIVILRVAGSYPVSCPIRLCPKNRGGVRLLGFGT